MQKQNAVDLKRTGTQAPQALCG